MKKEIIRKYYEAIKSLIREDLCSDFPLFDLYTQFSVKFREIVDPYLRGLTDEEVNSFFNEFEKQEIFIKEDLKKEHGEIATRYFGTF